MFLLLGLSGQLKIYVIGEFREVTEAFLSTANTIPRETWRRKQTMSVSNLPPKSSSDNTQVIESDHSHSLPPAREFHRAKFPIILCWPGGPDALTQTEGPLEVDQASLED